MPTTCQRYLILINSNVSSLNLSLYIYLGGLGIRIHFFLKDSDMEQICVELSRLDSRSLLIVRMDEKDCGSKTFHSLKKNYTEKSKGTLCLLHSSVDFRFSVHQSLGDLVITDVWAPLQGFGFSRFGWWLL